MKRTISTLILVSAASFAAVPVSFTSGTPAKADDVNKNFVALDSAIQKKADASLVSVLQTAVAAKADQTKLDDLTKTVSTKANQSDLNAKKDSAWIVATINSKPSTGTLIAKNNLSELKDSAAQVRANLGLKSLATTDIVAWNSVSKSGAKASDVGAFDSSTTKSRFMASNGTATLGGDFIIGNNPILRSASEWLLGVGDNQLKIGSEAYARPTTIWTGTTDTAAVFAEDHVTLGRNTFVRGGLSIQGSGGESVSLLGSGSGLYDLTAIYAYPQSGFEARGLLIEIPRLENNSSAGVSNFEVNVRGGHHSIISYDGTTDLLTLPRPTKIDDLTISGSIKTASGLIKASDVADYVFEPGYKLAPLSEVEAFTKANKHLPEVPSATEIEQGGLDLAKMNLLLLKKVEELTLHTIELEKRMKAFESAQKP